MSAVTRRQLFGSAGLSAGAGLLAGAFGPPDGSAAAPPAGGGPWKYLRLDPQGVADEAYRRFADGGCMYGLAAGIVTALAGKVGEPYQSFPLHMMRYGEGGVGGWGSLCGTLNGAAAVIGLVETDKARRAQTIAEIFSWYEQTRLPAYCPTGAQEPPARVPTSRAGSVLCHLSVARWCRAAKSRPFSPEMVERCRRLTADVAARTVTLLNRGVDSPDSLRLPTLPTSSCLNCHGPEKSQAVVGRMTCADCHTLPDKHPR